MTLPQPEIALILHFVPEMAFLRIIPMKDIQGTLTYHACGRIQSVMTDGVAYFSEESFFEILQNFLFLFLFVFLHFTCSMDFDMAEIISLTAT
jgi:hypothetical protein